LAARLEGANKAFGTECLITEETRKRLPAGQPVRTIARLGVVGRREPVTVHEPLTPEEATDRAEALAAFERGLGHFLAGELEAALAEFAPWADADPPARAYAEHCRDLLAAGGPYPDRDGVWRLDEK
jgi:adenylate cyclase